MSVVKHLSLYCDHPDCANEPAWNADLRDGTPAQIRAEARAYGWTRRNGKDYCPDHSDHSDSPGGER